MRKHCGGVGPCIGEQKKVDELNRLSNEAVAALRTGNTTRQKEVAKQLKKLVKKNFPVEGGKDFMQLVIEWLHRPDAPSLMVRIEALREPFRGAFKQMVAAAKQEKAASSEDSTAETDAITLDELLDIVVDAVSSGDNKQRQQLAESLQSIRQQLQVEQSSLAAFFDCLTAVLLDKTPELAALEEPFTKLWRQFQEALNE